MSDGLQRTILSLVEDEGSGQSENLEPTPVLPEALSP